jgi:hypothetical protein
VLVVVLVARGFSAVAWAEPSQAPAALSAGAAEPNAQAPAAEPEEYKHLIRDAVTEFDAGAFAESRALFQQAHVLLPSARTLRGLGSTAYELHHYVQAVQELQAALADPRNPLTEAQRKEAGDIIARCEGFIAKVRVELVPADATLVVDGVVVAEREIRLDLGDYLLSARAPGRKDSELKLRVDVGGPRDVKIELPPLDVPGPIAKMADEPAQPRSKAGAWPFVVVGVSGAVAVTGGVLVALALSSKANVESPKANSTWSEIKGDYHRVPALSTAGFVMIGAGLAGVAGGLLWKYMVRGDEQDRVRLTTSGTSLRVEGVF